MKRAAIILAACYILPVWARSDETRKPVLIDVRRIWDRAPAPAQGLHACDPEPIGAESGAHSGDSRGTLAVRLPGSKPPMHGPPSVPALTPLSGVLDPVATVSRPHLTSFPAAPGRDGGECATCFQYGKECRQLGPISHPLPPSPRSPAARDGMPGGGCLLPMWKGTSMTRRIC